MTSKRVNPTAAVMSDGLYVCGGFDGHRYLASVERFNPARSSWETVPPMPTAREGAVTGVLGEYLHVCGGNDGSQTLNVVERLSSSRHSWETLPPMSTRRDGAVGAVLRGKIYVCGGFDGEQSLSLSSTERFDPATGVWKSNSPMLARRAGA